MFDLELESKVGEGDGKDENTKNGYIKSFFLEVLKIIKRFFMSTYGKIRESSLLKMEG